MIRKPFRFSVLAVALLASASSLSAQMAERPADRLSRYLRELSGDPTSFAALIGAGQAALDVGDGNAALGFFARADERSPRSGPVKAGLARALLMVDNPREALKMFGAARSLGVADALVAGDRGLAHDLLGENRRAQQDYALALRGGANDELTKRYALSLGITGDRDQALKLLDPLLYKRDQGAWRARAFVLAMTGDTPGASKIAHQVMPARMAQTMDPFLSRLSALSATQKAAAVHLGEMPTNLRYAANTAVPPQPQPRQYLAYAAPTPSPAPTPAPAVQRQVESREPRRRPGAAQLMASPPPQRIVRVQPSPRPSPAPAPAPVVPEPVQVAQAAQPGPIYYAQPLPTPTPPPAARIDVSQTPVSRRGDLDAIIRELRSAASAPTPAPVRVAALTPTPRPAAVTRTMPAPTPTPRAKEPVVAKAKIDIKADAKAKAAALAKKKPELPKNPSRIWVQVAGGANAGALPREWSSLSGKAADLKSKGPYTARNRATNRLLTGPFKSEAEAQAAVARLRKAGVGAFQWRSDEGEAVDKLSGK